MDWVAMVCTLLGTLLCAYKHWLGWFFSLVSCVIWAVINIQHDIKGGALTNLILGALCIWSGVKWFKEER